MQLTPKEKADELAEKFYEQIQYLQGIDSVVTKWKCAIQCALVSVDEILQNITSDKFEYWVSVKEKLINL